MRILLYPLILFSTLLGNTAANDVRDDPATANRPNILLIMADDLGYSDIGCFGGEIPTPHLDTLAARGRRLAGLKTAPKCAPSRAMLLSSNDNHVAGYGRMFIHPHDYRFEGLPGYERNLSDRIVTFPVLLQEAGCYTCVAGKWHQGMAPSSDPAQQGFDDSWVLLDGAANHFNSKGTGLSEDRRVAHFSQNGQPVAYPTGTFSSTWYADQMIGYLNAHGKRQDERPFFAFLSFTAPHWPLQVPEEYRNLFRGHYDQGYDQLRADRLASQQRMGIVDTTVVLSTGAKDVPAWTDLTTEEQRDQSRRMELYAAMVHHMDQQIGRVVQVLRDHEQLDNTLIVFLSDNGADGVDFYEIPKNGRWVRTQYDNSYETMGSPTSFVCYGPGWAQASMSPRRGFKNFTLEGGISAPFLVAGPGISATPEVHSETFSIQDLGATFLDIVGVDYPEVHRGRTVVPMRGRSVWELWQGQPSYQDTSRVFATEMAEMAYVRQGSWKINSVRQADQNIFSLYHLPTDPGEQQDMSERFPDKKAALMQKWEEFKKEAGVQFLPRGEDE